ncbi:heparan-alpha-glucosaminide N-acetyltransferase-like isoform X2 [Stylophora pistillata]|uniref:heparan-alpha-glucosaminide N-acetyltransferase-like isoform X2 n=1 Tax=Stylophora pistillata TaxID=50429 RepID=UPI000C04D4EA|nr:heparan-alpha-glucosaminide N-acetyltransferase-like isoform X2 [Stylophora pistillata]
MSSRRIFSAAFLVLCLTGLVSIVSSSCPQEEKLSPKKLKMDTAFVNISSTLEEPVTILGISSNCYKCPIQEIITELLSSAPIVVSTHYSFTLSVKMKNGSQELCRLNYLFGGRGWYKYNIHQSDDQSSNKVTCKLEIKRSPDYPYMPLWIALGALFCLAVIWALLTCIGRKCKVACKKDDSNIMNQGESDDREDTEMRVTGEGEEQMQPETQLKAKPRRLKSLDTFRGIAITLMIFVNYGGGGYYFFGHAVWNGLLVADLVFPWFIWIMGVSITLSFRSLRRKKTRKLRIAWKILKRSVILFGLGLFTSNYGNLKYYRIPGVLQRFGVCYFFVAMMQLLLSPMEKGEKKKRWWEVFRDAFGLWKQWIFVLMLLAGYLTLTYGVNVPGCPKGYTGPGGIGQGYPDAFKCTGGMAGYIDRIALGNHLYRFPTTKDVYKTTLPYDPEGILGCLTSIVLVFFGVQAGHILTIHRKHKPRLIRWIIWAVLMTAFTLGLCGATKNEGIVPINKNLWSVSFILATGASAFFLFAICYLLTDVLDWWNGAPFFYPGMNSILVYVGHGILWRHFPFSWEMDEYGGHAEKLGMSLAGTALWVLIAYCLYTRNVFLKI